MVSLPFIYWLGFHLAFKEGKRIQLYELAKMELDNDPNFRRKMLNAQLDILNKYVYENE
jgi:hypothetical protein